MKHFFVIFFVVIISETVLAQKMPTDYFDEACTYFEDGNYSKSLSSFQYIVDNYPNNELYSKSYYNVGHICFLQKKYKKAIRVFNSILKSDFNEKESLGGGIMADPYTNYRHRASKLLSDIYFDKRQFKKSLYYLELSDSIYSYLHFCGNEYASNDVQTALRYSEIFQNLNEPDKAIEKLLPNVFITLANNSKIFDDLKLLLIKRVVSIDELDTSLNNIYSKSYERDSIKYTRYFFKYLNAEIPVPYYKNEKDSDFNIKEAIIKIKESNFYKLIEELKK